MTAGGGIVHGEMFPLLNEETTNENRFFQIWINLPAKSKMVTPMFAMHWAEEVPKIPTSDGLASLTLFAGTYKDQNAMKPPPDSWAADPANEVGVFHIIVKPGGMLTIPPMINPACKRSVYFIEGDKAMISGETFKEKVYIEADASKAMTLSHPGMEGENVEYLVLQGLAIGEPVAQHGPFVMNTQAEIRECFTDYQKDQFGGWPWPMDSMVFPKEKGRFSLLDKVETFPPTAKKDGEL
jgi:redox-sensitive bicupin YhaK (pirin superfamily)